MEAVLCMMNIWKELEKNGNESMKLTIELHNYNNEDQMSKPIDNWDLLLENYKLVLKTNDV